VRTREGSAKDATRIRPSIARGIEKRVPPCCGNDVSAMLSRSGAQSRSSFVGTSEVKTPVRLAFHSASSPVLALAVEKLNEDKQLEEVCGVT
jgi:hypothetical protein